MAMTSSTGVSATRITGDGPVGHAVIDLDRVEVAAGSQATSPMTVSPRPGTGRPGGGTKTGVPGPARMQLMKDHAQDFREGPPLAVSPCPIG